MSQKMGEKNTNNIYYGITSQAVRTENFNISLTSHKAHSTIDLHAHDKPYLCLLVSGYYKERNQNVEDISQGYAVFRNSNYEHANSFEVKDSLCLNIELNNENDFVNRNQAKIIPGLRNSRGSMASYRALYALKADASQDLLEIYCNEAIVEHLSSDNAKGSVRWIKKVQDYIHDNPHQPISLNKLSDMFGIHPNYVVRKFKESTGYRLSEYLVKVRLERSMNELINSESSITTIALNAGFYDQSHFNRNFKQNLAVTPSLFRKVIKG